MINKVLYYFSLFITFIFFVSCNNIKLEGIHEETRASSQNMLNYCSDPGVLNSDKINVVFIVDMSASNITVGKENGQFLPGTDRGGNTFLGKRFQIIKDFLFADCVKNKISSQFAIIGFSDNFILNTGGLCGKDLFKTPTPALGDITYLENIQKSDAPIILAGNRPQYMYSTNYLKGLDCASNTIKAHINAQPTDEKKNNAYMVYFLTDGLPTDMGGDIDTAKNPTFKSRLKTSVQNIMSIENLSAGVRVAPVFYGANFLDPERKGLADTIMDLIAKEGNSQKTSVDDVSEVEFCSLLNSGTRTKHAIKKFGIVNLTAKMTRGTLLADSDMDGLPDIEEAKLGYDPQNPRSGDSKKILDGLCFGQNASSCSFESSCDKNINKLLVNQCDGDHMNLSNLIDSDGDRQLDIVETLKGTRPNYAEPPDDDPDQDYLSTHLEVDRGRDPSFPDSFLTEKQIVSYENIRVPQTPSCMSPQEAYQVEIKNIPLVRTLPVHFNQNEFGENTRLLNHNKDENIVLIYYILERDSYDPNNPSPVQVYGQYLKVDYNMPVLRLGEFKLLGEIL